MTQGIRSYIRNPSASVCGVTDISNQTFNILIVITMKKDKQLLSGLTEYRSPECLLWEAEPSSVVCSSVLSDGTTEPIEDEPWTW